MEARWYQHQGVVEVCRGLGRKYVNERNDSASARFSRLGTLAKPRNEP